MSNLLKSVEAKINENIPALRSGDQVSVHVKIKEGDRERIQEFKGTVIRVGNAGNSRNFTVRRLASNGIGVERTFLLRSPLIDKVVVERGAKVRRAHLTYLKGLSGKRGRLKQKFEE
jgi:large subunit ribosomal protein L19